MGHFDLKLNPVELRNTAKSLKEIADHMHTSGKTARGTPEEIGDDWTGDAAESVKPEMKALGEQMGSSGKNYQKQLDAAAKALRTLATAYDTANEDIGDLNTKWNTAQDLDDDVERKKEETRLGKLFDIVEGGAQTATRAGNTALADNSPVEITHPDGPSGDPQVDRSGLFTHLSLAGQGKALEKYEATKQKIKDGDLPPFDEMTEDERKKFLEENPDLLPSLMKMDKPGRELTNDIISLATPRVTGKDGETAVDTTDEKASAADFLDAFTDAGDVSDAMALLGTWAKKNGVDLNGNNNVKNALSYQKSFLDTIGPHHEDVSNYFEIHEHTWKTGETKENIRGTTRCRTARATSSGIARAIGQSSDGIPPGDQPALELADNVQNDLYMEERDTAPGPRTEYELAGVGNDKELGALLEVISRNREATTAILTGDEGAVKTEGAGPYHQFSGELPDSFDHREFTRHVYTYRWEDKGEAASSLTAWMDDAFAAGEGNPDFENAQKSYEALTGTLTDSGDGNYQKLMDMHGSDKSLGEVNPELMRSLGLATEHLHILTDIATEGDEDATSANLRLLMLLADKEAGEGLAGAVEAYSGDVMTNDELNALAKADRIGNLRGLLDAGFFNEAYERTGDAQQAEDERAERIKTGIGMVTSLIPDRTGATGALGGLLSHYIEADNLAPVDPRIDPEWEDDGSHVALTSYDSLARSLNASGVISDEELERVRDYDAESASDHVYEHEELLKKHDIELVDKIPHGYTSRLNSWVTSGGTGKGSELEDLIEHGSMPGPG